MWRILFVFVLNPLFIILSIQTGSTLFTVCFSLVEVVYLCIILDMYMNLRSGFFINYMEKRSQKWENMMFYGDYTLREALREFRKWIRKSMRDDYTVKISLFPIVIYCFNDNQFFRMRRGSLYTGNKSVVEVIQYDPEIEKYKIEIIPAPEPVFLFNFKRRKPKGF